MSDTLEIKSSVEPVEATLYNSIETIPAYNWYKILETGDFRFSIEGFKGNFLASDIRKYKELLDYVEERRIDREERERELRVTLFEVDYIEAIRSFRVIMTEEIKAKIQDLEFKSTEILEENNTPELAKNWLELEQQHMDVFGTADELRRRTASKNKLHQLNLKFILSGKDGKPRDRSILNFIMAEEAKLESGKHEHFSFYEVLNAITKFQKVAPDPHKMPIIQWDYILKDMAKQNNNGSTEG